MLKNMMVCGGRIQILFGKRMRVKSYKSITLDNIFIIKTYGLTTFPEN